MMQKSIKKDLPESLDDVDDKDAFINEFVPKEFRELHISARLISANDFRKYPNLKNNTLLKTD